MKAYPNGETVEVLLKEGESRNPGPGEITAGMRPCAPRKLPPPAAWTAEQYANCYSPFRMTRGGLQRKSPFFLKNSKETPKVEATIRGEIGIAV